MGFSTSFIILPEEELNKKFSLRTNRYEYFDNEDVEIYLSNIGNANIDYSICGIQELKIFDENRKEMKLHDNKLSQTCNAKAFVLPGKTIMLYKWNLSHYICDNQNKCYEYKVPAGKYYISFRGVETEILVKGRINNNNFEIPPALPSLEEFKIFNLTVKKGWNMISIPMNGNFFILTNNCSSNIAFEYENNYYAIRNVSSLQGKKGYFIYNSNNDCQISFIGYGFLSKSNFIYNLKKGWNVIGSTIDIIRKNELKGCSILHGPISYSASTNSYEQNEYLIPGKAYWINVREDCELKVN
ncbi:MAG: hypothetical protein QXF76_02245 [Candidatus Anstonellales archaeon]